MMKRSGNTAARLLAATSLILSFLLMPLLAVPAGAHASREIESGSIAEGSTDLVQESPSADRESEPSQEIATEEDIASAEISSAGLTMATASSSSGDGNNAASIPVVDTSQFTGAAVVGIPIVVPPGRSGMAPNLALVYNSYRKNGWIGVGWDLDMGAIQRSTKHGVNYTANDFVVVSNGSSSELVSRGDWGANYYGAKIEGGFAKHYYNSATGGWEVITKDGKIYFYGSAAASRQDNTHGVFKWCLDRVEDTNGNYMTVSYHKEQGEIYLAEINYTGNDNGTAPIHSVILHRKSRTDAPPKFTTDAAVNTSKILDKICIYGNGSQARQYVFQYQYSVISGRSLLDSVVVHGDDFASEDAYHGFNWHQESQGWLQMPSVNSLSPGQGYTAYNQYPSFSGDFNGDGRTDIGRVSGSGVSFFSWTGSNWVQLNGLNTLSPGQGYSDANTYPLLIGDFDADGRTDIGRVGGSGIAFFRSTGSSWQQTGGIASLSPGQGYTDANTYPVFTGDFNGDGRTDIGRVSGSGVIFFKSTDTGWQQINGIAGLSPSQGYTDAVTYPVVTGDFNGDGRIDVGRVDSSGVSFFCYTGSVWEQMNSLLNLSPGQGYTDRITNPIFTGDFNGDGKTDIGRVSGSGVIFFLSTGSGWQQMAGLSNLSPAQGYTDAGVYPLLNGDFNGDSKADIGRVSGSGVDMYRSTGTGWVQICSLPGISPGQGYTDTSTYPMFSGDFDGDGKADAGRVDGQGVSLFASSGAAAIGTALFPDLLSSVSNSFGSSVALEYIPSSHYPNGLLPIIVHTVSQITTNDGNGTVAETNYAYEGGLFDFEDRDFRGFEKVTQTNPDGTTIKTTFHQDTYLKGRQEKIEVWEANTNPAVVDPYSRTLFTWETFPEIPAEGAWAFAKLSQKRIDISDLDPTHSQVEYTYNNTHGGVLTTVTSGTGAENVTKTNQYENIDPSGWMWRLTQETVTGATGDQVRQTTYDYYNTTGNLWKKTFSYDGGTDPLVEMTYDAYGNVVTVIDARENPVLIEYETTAHTFPWRITYPSTNGVSHVLENEVWDYRFGKVTQTKDENGNQTYYTLDEFGRTIRVETPDGGKVITAYHDDVFPRYTVTSVLETAPSGYIQQYDYFDGLGRPIQQVTFGENGQAIATRQYYDTMGRDYLSQGPFFASAATYPQTPSSDCPWSETTFDNRGRPAAIETPDDEQTGTVTASIAYNGNSVTVTDPTGGRKKETKDYLGRLIQVKEYGESSAEYTTSYAYNAAGDLLTVTDAAGNVTTINYDSLGRKIDMTDPDMGCWSYTYDANGNLHTQTDAIGQEIEFKYDALNRVIKKLYKNTLDPSVKYEYDNLTISNGKGRQSSFYTHNPHDPTDIYNKTTYGGYDAMGRVSSVTKTIKGDPTPRTTAYAYGLAGQLEQFTYPDSFSVDYAYHSGTGLLHTVTGSDNVTYATFTDYNPAGKMGRIDYGNGAQTLYDYYPKTTRLETIWTKDAADNPIHTKAYHYTPAGDIRQIADGLTTTTYTYTYDSLHRLIGETNDVDSNAYAYSYNAIGNITSRTVTGTSNYAFSYSAYSPAHKHAVSQITLNGTPYAFTYDANGNMHTGWDFTDPTSPATRTIEYNADNMPSSITHSTYGATSFVYDGEGARVKKTTTASSTYYFGNHFEIEAGTAVKYIFAGGQRVARKTAAATYYFHQDHLGSASVVTDAAGAQVEATEYLPFGGQRSHSGTLQAPYKFTDQELDASTGLYNYNARFYDPFTGRFISADTMVPEPFNPQSLNRYSYCLNNPLSYIDPTGHDAEEPWDIWDIFDWEWWGWPDDGSYILDDGTYVLDNITVTAPRNSSWSDSTIEFGVFYSTWTIVQSAQPILDTAGIYLNIQNIPVMLIDPSGLFGISDSINWINTKRENIGIAIFNLNPGVDSDLEKSMVDHYFRGNGSDFELSQNQWQQVQDGIACGDNTYYDQGLGAFSGSVGKIDRYDFSPLITDRSYGGGFWNNIKNNALNVGGATAGFIFGGNDYDVYAPK